MRAGVDTRRSFSMHVRSVDQEPNMERFGARHSTRKRVSQRKQVQPAKPAAGETKFERWTAQPRLKRAGSVATPELASPEIQAHRVAG